MELARMTSSLKAISTISRSSGPRTPFPSKIPYHRIKIIRYRGPVLFDLLSSSSGKKVEEE